MKKLLAILAFAGTMAACSNAEDAATPDTDTTGTTSSDESSAATTKSFADSIAAIQQPADSVAAKQPADTSAGNTKEAVKQ
jgi:hypothetical protein